MPRGQYDRTKVKAETTTTLPAMIKRLDAIEKRIATALASLKPLADERLQLRNQIDQELRRRDKTINGASIPPGAITEKPEPVLPDVSKPITPWTPDRLRRLMAILDIDADLLARKLGVEVAHVYQLLKDPRAFDDASSRLIGRLELLEAQSKREAE